MTSSIARFAISVLTSDRVGIMRGITAAVADLGGNIEGISQTVVQGYFTVILIAAFPHDVTANAITDTVAAACPCGKGSVLVRHAGSVVPAPPPGPRYILTLMGREAPGILKQLTAYLAEKGINIEDWYFRVDGPAVTHIGEITVPPRLDIRQLQDDLRALLEPRDLRVHCRHENLFRATNEIESIRRMLGTEPGSDKV